MSSMSTKPSPPELSKQQYQKMMKRPSMSELTDEVTRMNRRSDRSLEQENFFVDKLVKLQLSDHRKKSKDFVKSQTEKFTNQPMRRRSDTSFMDDKLSTSFRRLSNLDPPSRRGSLPQNSSSRRSSSSFSTNLDPPSQRGSLPQNSSSRRSSSSFSTYYTPAAPSDNSASEDSSQGRLSRRRHSELSASRSTNRTLEIRRRLYREFNMEGKTMRQRPWSPQQCADSQSAADEQLKMINRRMSEPILTISDRLSDELEARLAYITGKESRHSTATDTLTSLVGDDTEANSDGAGPLDKSHLQPSGGESEPSVPPEQKQEQEQEREQDALSTSTPKPPHLRRSSEILGPSKSERTSLKLPKQRRFSETTNRGAGHRLPPLTEQM